MIHRFSAWACALAGCLLFAACAADAVPAAVSQPSFPPRVDNGFYAALTDAISFRTHSNRNDNPDDWTRDGMHYVAKPLLLWFHASDGLTGPGSIIDLAVFSSLDIAPVPSPATPVTEAVYPLFSFNSPTKFVIGVVDTSGYHFGRHWADCTNCSDSMYYSVTGSVRSVQDTLEVTIVATASGGIAGISAQSSFSATLTATSNDEIPALQCSSNACWFHYGDIDRRWNTNRF